jgi:hypothetical protein
MTKRLVLEHRVGALAGLSQILGTDDQLSEKLQTTKLPSLLDPVNFGDHMGMCGLAKVTPRYILYREIVTPCMTPVQEPTIQPANSDSTSRG